MSLFFLIGMPGAGKSYWGRRWAKDRDFMDLDEAIEAGEGMKIPEVFREHGEPWFREREHHYLNLLIASAAPGTIIATGGGTPLFHDHMALMKAHGCVVYLKGTVSMLARNIRGDSRVRPLLAAGGLEANLARMLESRGGVYSGADLILPLNHLSDVTFAQILTLCINPLL